MCSASEFLSSSLEVSDNVGKPGSGGRRRDLCAVKCRSCAGQRCAEETRCKGQEGIKRERWRIFYAQRRSAALVTYGGLLLLLGQLDLHLTKSAGMDSCIIAVLVICSLTAPALGDKGTSKARSCSDIKLFYSGKGFALDSVPQSEISGKPRQKQSPSLRFIFFPHSAKHTYIHFQRDIEAKVYSTR